MTAADSIALGVTSTRTALETARLPFEVAKQQVDAAKQQMALISGAISEGFDDIAFSIRRAGFWIGAGERIRWMDG